MSPGTRLHHAPNTLVATALMLAAQLFAATALAWNSTDVTGALPPLDFTMTRASDGKTVTANDYRGKIVLLYFGYTFCPDVCPTTLLEVGNMLKTLGKRADDVRVLFVTVDPNRDTLPVLDRYAKAFGPQVVGLRGTPDQLAAFAKRYRVAYSVQPESLGRPYTVTHGAAVYVFNRNGEIKLLFTGLGASGVDASGETSDLKQMVIGAGSDSWWRRVLSLL